MASIVMNERRITAGLHETSANFQVPNEITFIHLELTSSEWMTKNGTVKWGIEASADGSTNWVLMGGSTFTIGVLNKGIYMPTIGVEGMDRFPFWYWRMYIEPSVTIRMGMIGNYG